MYAATLENATRILAAPGVAHSAGDVDHQAQAQTPISVVPAFRAPAAIPTTPDELPPPSRPVPSLSYTLPMSVCAVCSAQMKT
jgi:hypothetical protein